MTGHLMLVFCLAVVWCRGILVFDNTSKDKTRIEGSGLNRFVNVLKENNIIIIKILSHFLTFLMVECVTFEIILLLKKVV